MHEVVLAHSLDDIFARNALAQPSVDPPSCDCRRAVVGAHPAKHVLWLGLPAQQKFTKIGRERHAVDDAWATMPEQIIRREAERVETIAYFAYRGLTPSPKMLLTR